MKIMFVLPRPVSMIFGGCEVQAFRTAEALRTQGVTVEFLDFTDAHQMTGVDGIHFFGCDHTFDQVFELSRARGLPTFVSPIYYPVGLRKQAIAAIARVPRSIEYLRRRIVNTCTRVLPNSVSEVRTLHEVFGTPVQQCRVIPNGVAPDDLGGDAQRFHARFPGVGQDERFVLSVGRIEPRKRSVQLLRAAMQCGTRIVFVGQPVQTERRYVEEFFALGQTYPKFHHIPFLAQAAGHLADAYHAAHVHALISTLETPGLASLEAGACGANLVVSACPPVQEYLDGYSFVCQGHKLADVTARLSAALAAPRDVQGQQAMIVQHYSWEHVGARTMQAYREVL